MPSFNLPETWVANGNINPCRFVKVDSSIAKGVVIAGANDAVIGVSQEGFASAPIPTNTSGYAGTAGLPMGVYTNGAICLLELGTGGATEGGYLKSDASGKGVAVATTGVTKQSFGAQAMETGLAGEKIRVRVYIDEKFVALS
jgi:hypothetical protein